MEACDACFSPSTSSDKDADDVLVSRTKCTHTDDVESSGDDSDTLETTKNPRETTNADYATINECTTEKPAIPNGVRDQEVLAVERLSHMNDQLALKLDEMRTTYKQLCLELEEKKAIMRLQEVQQDSIKDSTVNLNQYVIRLPEPMNRAQKEHYVHFLLTNVLHDLHNIHNVAMGEMLDDDVITTVMETCQAKNSDLLFVNPCITQCIQFSQDDDIASFLDPLNAKSYDNIFFVINDTSNGNQGTHWSLLLLSKQAKAFCHYDSLKGMNDMIALELSKKLSGYFDTWQFLDIECEQQTNNTDCGIYVLDNMLRVILVLKNNLNIEGERITSLKISNLPPSFTKTRIYMIITYINAVIQKAKRTLRLEERCDFDEEKS